MTKVDGNESVCMGIIVGTSVSFCWTNADDGMLVRPRPRLTGVTDGSGGEQGEIPCPREGFDGGRCGRLENRKQDGGDAEGWGRLDRQIVFARSEKKFSLGETPVFAVNVVI